MVKIGIIDDNSSEVDDIQTTIYTTWGKLPETPNEVDFKCYALARTTDFKTKLQEEILHDIEHKEIQSLIVDYKLDSLRKVMEGKEIVEFLHSKVPSFPVVVLTNAPSGSKQEESIDPDKVYYKRIFFDLTIDESQEMALKIYLNIKRYVNRRTELENKLDELLTKLPLSQDTEVNIALLSEISEVEEKLSGYTITGQTVAERDFDLTELRDIIKELRELEGL